MASLNYYMQSIVLFLGILVPAAFKLTGAQTIGVCYGRNGNNLPSEKATVDLYGANQIKGMRLYDPVPAALDALRGKDIEVILDVPLTQLESLQDRQAAGKWVDDNIKKYGDVKFRYIAVGNEVDPDKETSQYVGFVLPAMRNLHDAIVAAGLQDQIKVSTATYSGLIGLNSSPPSASSFKASATNFIQPIIQFLAQNNLPLLANIYPYFSINGGQDLDYALFRAANVVVPDGSLGYKNLFDALVDVMYTAVEKADGQNIEIVVSESGWPSAGGSEASVENAGTYYKNLIDHVRTSNGTPKKQGKPIQTYLFAMYDENNKGDPATEQHFGLFDPTNQQQKYNLKF